MKILIGVATYPTTPELYPATQASIDALERGEHEVVIEYYGNDDPALDPKDNITAKHNQMRARLLNLAYDALLTIEADMIVPPDALVKLAEVEASVVYAPYASRHHPMILTFPAIDGYKGRSISADEALWRPSFGQVIACEGVGFGCTLIHRRVLEAVEFRRDTRSAIRRQFADDWTFALDVKEAGFVSAAHLGVLCGHIQRDGRVRWVDAEAPAFMRLDGEAEAPSAALPPMARYRVRKWLFGSMQNHAPGSEIELGAETASVLLGLGKIERI